MPPGPASPSIGSKTIVASCGCASGEDTGGWYICEAERSDKVLKKKKKKPYLFYFLGTCSDTLCVGFAEVLVQKLPWLICGYSCGDTDVGIFYQYRTIVSS